MDVCLGRLSATSPGPLGNPTKRRHGDVPLRRPDNFWGRPGDVILLAGIPLNDRSCNESLHLVSTVPFNSVALDYSKTPTFQAFHSDRPTYSSRIHFI